MSMPISYTYFNRLGLPVKTAFSDRFTWIFPETEDELREEALRAVFKMASRISEGRYKKCTAFWIRAVAIEDTKISFKDIKAYIQSGKAEDMKEELEEIAKVFPSLAL